MPGAQKILVLAGIEDHLALESNGLRVLLRLGHGGEKRNYDATYRSVQDALVAKVRGDSVDLECAHLILRTHGKTLCKNSSPMCDECCLVVDCPSKE